MTGRQQRGKQAQVHDDKNDKNYKAISEEDWQFVLSSLKELKKIDDIGVDLAGLKTSAQYQSTLIQELTTENKGLKSDVEKLTRTIHKQNAIMDMMFTSMMDMQMQVDELAQYSRRESIRISGIPESNEDLASEIVKLGHDIGVNIATADISVVHRSGKPGNRTMNGDAKPRDILCRFISRKTKDQLCENRKKLKEARGRKNVYINEDLTYFRSKMAAYARKAPATKYVFTKNGKVLCYLKDKDGPPIHLAKPTDLTKLGMDVPDLK